ncbi:hypothetical protein V2J09_019282 [Rumex salicifolius]
MGQTSHEHIAYALTLAFLSTFSLVLALVLVFLCKKQPVESEENLPITIRPNARAYPLAAVDLATDGFNPRQVLGKGRLGTTYIGVLDGGILIAAKRIHSSLVLSQGGFGFTSMIKPLSLAQHPHIVPIVGYSEGPGERIILTELVSTMSLDQFYSHQDSQCQGEPPMLDWSQRVRIASGVARGLGYLHSKMSPPVVHGSVKPSNILVDSDLRARVCDFGLGFLGPPKEKDVSLVGYVDEEYWVGGTSGSPCKESDVYGFGVVVLELLSGRRSEQGLLVKWGLPLIKEMRFSELLDQRLVAPAQMKPLVRLAKVASACVDIM